MSEINSIYLDLQHDGMCQQNILVNTSLFLLFLAGFEVLMCVRKLLYNVNVSRAQQTFAATFEISFFLAAQVGYSSGFCKYRTQTLA